MVTTRPFRAPHYTTSDVGLIGGRLVKHVIQRSRPSACSLVPVPGRVGAFSTPRGVSRHYWRTRCDGCTTVCACWKHSRSVGVTSLRCRSTGRRHASTPVERGGKAPAGVAARMGRIAASLDDPAEGPLMMPSWSRPSSGAPGMARLGTLTAEEVQSSLQARTAITDTPATRPSERVVGAAEVTEGMASSGCTAPAADSRTRRPPRCASGRGWSGAGTGPWRARHGVSAGGWATRRPPASGPVRPADDPPRRGCDDG
jgi:hypothetical protein